MAKFTKQDKQNLTIPLMSYHLDNIETALLALNKAFISASYSNSILKLTRMDGTSVSFDLSTTGSETVTESVDYTLTQGAWVQSGLSTDYSNRVGTTEAIPGKFYVKVNDGYVIRAVYSYTSASGSTGTMVADTSTTRTEFTSDDATLYYGVTFTKTDATADITPDEDIVAEWYIVE